MEKPPPMRNSRLQAKLARVLLAEKGGNDWAEKKGPAETPIVENEYVKELLTLLKENQSPAGKELLEAIGHVSEMEKQLPARLTS